MKKAISFLFPACILLISCSTLNNRDDEGGNSLAGYGGMYHQIPCQYVALEGLKPYGGSGFGIEPHTLKDGDLRRYVLMIDYDTRTLQQWEEKAVRSSTGEQKGSFHQDDTDPGGDILCNRVSSISVTSSEDFNSIPAGESLSSVLMFFSWSVWPSIQAGKDLKERSGNKDLYLQYFHFNPIPECFSYSPVNKMLNNINTEDLYLLGSNSDNRGVCPAMFMFTESPAVKQHIFTVTYREENQSWSVEIPADFSL